MQTSFVTDINGEIKIKKLKRFFRFQTRTTITESCRAVVTTRKMALGLFDYFLANEPFRATVARENQVHALRFANQ